MNRQTARWILLVGLVAGLIVSGRAAGAQQAGVTVTYQVSCLSENGRVDVDIINTNASSVDISVTITGLQPRLRTVPGASTQRLSITGRPDRSYDLIVESSGETILADSFDVSCDPPPTAVRVASDCVSGNGRVSVSLTNIEAAAGLYSVTVGSLRPRQLTIQPGLSGRATVTGRPDGSLLVTVVRNGRTIESATVDIACDAQLPAGVEVVIASGCVAENGFFHIDVQNRTGAEAVYEILVSGLQPRSKTVAADRTARFIVTGRPDGRYDIVVSRAGTAIGGERGLIIICDPIEQLVPVVRSVVPHDTGAFTQGFVIDQGRLFESTGAPAGFSSTVRELDIDTGEVLRFVDYGTGFFGEGLALVGDRLIYLSWLQGVARVIDRDSFAALGEFSYTGQGWGLCHDGQQLVMSNGSGSLTFRDPETFAVVGDVGVTRAGAAVTRLNELECVDGYVWANVWLTDDILKIDPVTGAVVAVVDASALEQPRPASSNAVLNGIAYDAESQRFWLTGKEWPAMYEVDFTKTDAVLAS